MSGMRSFALALACLAVFRVQACPNSCSGHGTCGEDDVCICYQNWGSADAMSGDCSQRYCPHDISFVGTPDASGKYHRYMECSGKGICDRAIGECQCFEGYSGKSCQRMVCPGALEDTPGVYCNGHGSCEFLEEIGYGDHVGLYYDGTEAGRDNIVLSKAKGHKGITFETSASHLWEHRKIMHCACDATYFGPDCSLRRCELGNDINHHRITPLDEVEYHVQELRIYGGGPTGGGFQSNLSDFYGHTFAMTFTSHLNESYTTRPIEVGNSSNITDIERDLAEDIRLCLGELPHRMIDVIETEVELGYEQMEFNFTDTDDMGMGPPPTDDMGMGPPPTDDDRRRKLFATQAPTAQTTTSPTIPSPSALPTTSSPSTPPTSMPTMPPVAVPGGMGPPPLGPPPSGPPPSGPPPSGPPPSGGSSSTFKYNVAYIHARLKFIGKHNIGKQKLVTISYKKCVHCTPQLGVNGQMPIMIWVPGSQYPRTHWIKETNIADYNSYECGRRGKCDYDTGICDCFEGYYGDNCGFRNELI